jgi:hypothetical protein
MISVLLDHPWSIQVDRDPLSEGFGVLRNFVRLVSNHRLTVVPFIEPDDFHQCNCWSAPRTSGLAALRRSAHQYVRWVSGSGSATPNPEPPGLAASWKRALRDAMRDIDDWRCPQIIVCLRRRPQWAEGSEVNIHFDEHEQQGVTDSHQRVIAVLESYTEHPFALSDTDPWNQERFRPSSPGGRFIGRRCLLPRPPNVDIRASLKDLDSMVDRARTWGQKWESDHKYYFIPPPSWQAKSIGKADWRREVFENHYLNGKKGPADYKGRVWYWAEEHGQHWDLQLLDGSHKNINQNGDEV